MVGIVEEGDTKRSTTYLSFGDNAPTYSYLDLSRTRSDESLLWSAGDEAARIVAQLRASLQPTADKAPPSPADGLEENPYRSRSFTNLSSSPSTNGDLCRNFCRPYLPPPEIYGAGGTPHIGSGIGSLLRRNKDPSRFSFRKKPQSLNLRDPEGVFPPHSPRSKQENLKNFSGSWRSLLKLGGMSGRSKNGPPVPKKVLPPTVPDGGGSSSSSTCSSTSSSSSSHRHSGSSFSSGVFSSNDQRASLTSSLGEESSSSNPPPSPRSPGRDSGNEGAMVGSITSTGSNSSGGSAGEASVSSGSSGIGGSASPSHSPNAQFTFPNCHQVPQFAHLMCPKVSPGSPHHLPVIAEPTPYTCIPYQTQASIEDQGIDVQSPGRSSPGSGSGSSTAESSTSSVCRNSNTSLDSGRASSSTNTHTTHRLSGHSYHSSSSSLGSSVEHEAPLNINVLELIKKGVPDSEVLLMWLTELRFEEYYEKFLSAGYDMPTISRMTPEDLNAIGITKPAHRKRLKAEITRLNISDCLPDYIPSRLEEWLALLRLDSYAESLRQQDYKTVQQVTQITWEDLEDVGITKLGHQKKVMLAIKRVKDIMAGKMFYNGSQLVRDSSGKLVPLLSHYSPQEIVIGREPPDGREAYPNMAEMRTFQATLFNHRRGVSGGTSDHPQDTIPIHSAGSFHRPVPSMLARMRYPGCFAPQDKVVTHHSVPNSNHHYRPDLVAVNVRKNGRGIRDEAIYGTYRTFIPGYYPPQWPPNALPLSQNGCPPHRSLDDGDITPTNEVSTVAYEGGGTLPRPRNAAKYRPVAKVAAKTRVEIHEVPQFAKEAQNGTNIPNDFYTSSSNNNNFHRSHSLSKPQPTSTNNTPQGTPKKLPPPPPRRSNSISESSKDTTCRDNHHYNNIVRRGLPCGYMNVKNNLQPDLTPDLPPPPPAPQDRGNHQHLPMEFPPPPPPLTCITMATSAARCSSSGGSLSSCDEVPSNFILDTEVTELGFRSRRNDSNASFKSTSSTDSGESLPFANDNAGTIKARTLRPHIGFALMEGRSSPRGSPASSPALRRKEGVVLPTMRQMQPQPTHPLIQRCSNLSPQLPIKGVSSSPNGTNDVLNDIGNMLANLTDELDAMLEHDLVVKN